MVNWRVPTPGTPLIESEHFLNKKINNLLNEMCPRFGLIAWLKEWRYGQSNQNFFIDILSRCTTSIDLNPNQFMSYIHRAVVKLVLLKIYSVEYTCIDLKDSNDAKIKITFNDFQDSQKKIQLTIFQRI